MTREPHIQYVAIFTIDERPPTPVGLICAEVTLGRPRTATYNRIRERWEYNTSGGVKFLFDMDLQAQTDEVTRQEAERIAQVLLGTELPSEEELHQRMVEAEAAEGV